MSFTPLLAPHAPDWITYEGAAGSFCRLCGASRGMYAAAHPVKVESVPAGTGSAFFKADR